MTTTGPLLDRAGIATLMGVLPETVSQYIHRHRRIEGIAPTWPDPDRVYSNGALRLWRQSRIEAWVAARDQSTDYDPNPPMVDPEAPEDILIDMDGIGAELNVARSFVTRLRYLHRPEGPFAHIPFPEPAVTHGRIPLFRRDAVRDFQRARPGRTGRPRKDGQGGEVVGVAVPLAPADALPYAADPDAPDVAVEKVIRQRGEQWVEVLQCGHKVVTESAAEREGPDRPCGRCMTVPRGDWRTHADQARQSTSAGGTADAAAAPL